MAFLLPLVSAGLLALSCLLALPQADASGVARVRLRQADPLGELTRLLERAGSSELAQASLELGQVAAVAADVAARVERRRGVRLSPGAAVVLMACAWALAALAASWWAGSFAGGVVCAPCAAAWACVRAAALERARSREVAEEMPALLRSVAGSLAAGQSLPQAIEYAARHGKGPAAQSFGRVSMRLRCGEPMDEALSALASEISAPGVGMLVGAFRISRRTGSPLAGLLERAAELVERQQEFEQLLAVKTAQARLSARIVCSLPAVMVGLLLLISPDFQRGASTGAGVLAIAVAAALDGIALLSIRRLMRGVV